MDSRTEFWRQQKPIYARKSAFANSSGYNSKSPQAYIQKQFDIIEECTNKFLFLFLSFFSTNIILSTVESDFKPSLCLFLVQTNGKHGESLDKSNRLMVYVNKLTDSQLTNKKAVICNIYSLIGNAYLEMGKYDDALQAHQKDLEISREIDSKQDISRAYENIGRVYARNGKYKEAIQVWEKKLPLTENDMEKAWLYHEIGNINDKKNFHYYLIRVQDNSFF